MRRKSPGPCPGKVVSRCEGLVPIPNFEFFPPFSIFSFIHFKKENKRKIKKGEKKNPLSAVAML
jgi:hypothetical protein